MNNKGKFFDKLINGDCLTDTMCISKIQFLKLPFLNFIYFIIFSFLVFCFVLDFQASIY